MESVTVLDWSEKDGLMSLKILVNKETKMAFVFVGDEKSELYVNGKKQSLEELKVWLKKTKNVCVKLYPLKKFFGASLKAEFSDK